MHSVITGSKLSVSVWQYSLAQSQGQYLFGLPIAIRASQLSSPDLQSRIEELESRCVRLTQQTRTLASEKEEMAKSLTLLKDLVQVRELQIVAVTSRLAQLNTGPGAIKTEISGLEGTGGLEALLQQQPTVQALEAIQSARVEAQVVDHLKIKLQ